MPQTSPTPRSKTSSPPASGPRLEGTALVQRIAELCREKRGADVVALDVRRLVDYMDFLVLVTGTSERQNRAIVDHVLRSLRPAKVRPLSTAGEDGGTWICVDFVDVVLHVFDAATRNHYDLELLWADAERTEL